MQHTASTCDCDNEKKVTKRQGARTAAVRASTGRPSVEAVAMAGDAVEWLGAMCAGHDDVGDDHEGGGGGTAEAQVPEHLRAFEAFLEEVVPADMVAAYRREEDARVRRGGERRSYDEDVKEKLKLWAKAVVKTTAVQRCGAYVNHRS